MPNSFEKFESSLNRMAPEMSQDILRKYNLMQRELDQKISKLADVKGSNVDLYLGYKAQLESARDTIIGNSDSMNKLDAKKMIESFYIELDSIRLHMNQLDESAKAILKEKKPRNKEVEKRAKALSLIEVLPTYVKNSLVNHILSERVEKSKKVEITYQQSNRLKQLGMIRQILVTIRSNIKNSKTYSEWIQQAFTEFEGTTSMRIHRVTRYIAELELAEKAIIADKKVTLDKIIPEEVKTLLRGYKNVGYTNVSDDSLFDKKGKLLDVETDIAFGKQMRAFMAFLRGMRDYNSARSFIETDVFGSEFKRVRDLMPAKFKAKFEREMRRKVNLAVNDKMLKKWADEIIENNKRELVQFAREKLGQKATKKEIDAYISKNLFDKIITPQYALNLADLRRERVIKRATKSLENLAIAKMKNGLPFKVDNDDFTQYSKGQLLKMYKDMMGTGEWHNISDETQDLIVDTAIKDAPVMMAAGILALGVRGVVLASGVNAVNAGTNMAKWGLKISSVTQKGVEVKKVVSTSLKGRAILAGARTGAWLAAGTTFDLAHKGMVDIEALKNRGLKQWAVDIFFSTATLAVFAGSSKLAGRINKVISENITAFNGPLRELIQSSLVHGMTETAAMLALGAAQHAAATKGDMTDWKWTDQILHALVTVGAFKISTRVIRSAGVSAKNAIKDIRKASADIKKVSTFRRLGAKEASSLALKDPVLLEQKVAMSSSIGLGVSKISQIANKAVDAGKPLRKNLVVDMMMKSKEVLAFATKSSIKNLAEYLSSGVQNSKLRSVMRDAIVSRLKVNDGMTGFYVMRIYNMLRRGKAPLTASASTFLAGCDGAGKAWDAITSSKDGSFLNYLKLQMHRGSEFLLDDLGLVDKLWFGFLYLRDVKTDLAAFYKLKKLDDSNASKEEMEKVKWGYVTRVSQWLLLDSHYHILKFFKNEPAGNPEVKNRVSNLEKRVRGISDIVPDEVLPKEYSPEAMFDTIRKEVGNTAGFTNAEVNQVRSILGNIENSYYAVRMNIEFLRQFRYNVLNERNNASIDGKTFSYSNISRIKDAVIDNMFNGVNFPNGVDAQAVKEVVQRKATKVLTELNNLSTNPADDNIYKLGVTKLDKLTAKTLADFQSEVVRHAKLTKEDRSSLDFFRNNRGLAMSHLYSSIRASSKAKIVSAVVGHLFIWSMAFGYHPASKLVGRTLNITRSSEEIEKDKKAQEKEAEEKESMKARAKKLMEEALKGATSEHGVPTSKPGQKKAPKGTIDGDSSVDDILKYVRDAEKTSTKKPIKNKAKSKKKAKK